MLSLEQCLVCAALSLFLSLHFPLAALLAACSSSSTPPDAVPAGADLVVTADSGLRFDARSYGPVPSGDRLIAYRNDDQMRHTLVLARNDELVPGFGLVVAARGDVSTANVALETGEYTLICDVPGHANMRATLTVD